MTRNASIMNTMAALTTLLSGDASSQVQGLALEDKHLNVLSLGQEDVFQGLMNMAQDGVIRIPITKEETGYLSQLHSQADTSNISASDILSLSTSTKKTAVTTLKRTNFKVKEPLTNSQNLSYVGELYMGSPVPQKVRAIFDTGSANPWILSKEAASKDEDYASISHPYDHLISKSYVEPSDEKKQWVDISFGSGHIKGYFVQDQVLMGSPTDTENQLSLTDWTFGMVVDNGVFNGKFDALIGMAYP